MLRAGDRGMCSVGTVNDGEAVSPREEPSDAVGKAGLPELRLNLDDQLEGSAQHLRALARAKDRLQGLLSAVLAIGGDLDLPTVLRRIVTTAMDLAGARYGALGVLAPSGDHLEQFITAGRAVMRSARCSARPSRAGARAGRTPPPRAG